jgi:hypothetical protein
VIESSSGTAVATATGIVVGRGVGTGFGVGVAVGTAVGVDGTGVSVGVGVLPEAAPVPQAVSKSIAASHIHMDFICPPSIDCLVGLGVALIEKVHCQTASIILSYSIVNTT